MPVVEGNLNDVNAQNGVYYLYYNGVVMTGPRLTLDFNANPIMSDDERIVIGQKCVVNVRMFINDDPEHMAGSLYSVANPGAADKYFQDRKAYKTNLSTIFGLLNENGHTLELRGMGLDILVNDVANSSESFVDLQWGPLVRDFKVTPVGAIGAHMTFAIEFQLSICEWDDSNESWLGLKLNQVGANPVGITGLSFSVRYDINSTDGTTVRTITGRLKVANKRSARTTLPLTVVDEYRGVIAPVVPLGFRRAASNWNIAANKSDLDFQIVDQELPSGLPYPPGVVEITLEHEAEMGPLGQSNSINTMMILCTLSGSVQVLKTVSKGAVFDILLPMLQSRVDRATALGGQVIVARVLIREKIWPTPGFDFSISYAINGNNAGQMFGNLLARAGLFTDLTFAHTWATWRDSMAGAWHNRGFAQLQFTKEQDAIISNCVIQSGALADYQAIVPIANGGGSLTSVCPAPEYSYLFWKNEIETEIEGEVVPWKRYMPGAPSTTTGGEVVSGDGVTVRMPILNPATVSDMGGQQTAPQTVIVRVKGVGKRLGYPVESPRISRTLRDQIPAGVVPAGKPRILNLPAGDHFGCKVFEATWQFVWEMPAAAVDSFITLLRAEMVFTDADPSGIKDGGT